MITNQNRDQLDKKEYELLERKLDEKNEQLALLLKQKKNEQFDINELKFKLEREQQQN